MNKIILLGRIVRDPEVRYTQGQNAMAIGKFSLAVNRKYKKENEPEADFFNCTSFGKQAAVVEKDLKTGSKALIAGRVQTANYTNKEGRRVYSIQNMVVEIEFAESKGNNTETQPVQQQSNDYVEIPESLQEELPFN